MLTFSVDRFFGGNYAIQTDKMQLFYTNILISDVCYMFRTRGFIFRKMVVHRRMVYDVRVTMHRDKFLIIKPTRCTDFSNLFLEANSTCFGQFLCPSSGV